MTPAQKYIEQQQPSIGQHIGLSGWIDLPQSQVDQFAALTGDQQFIHVDPQRAARETPYGSTIVHGFFVLSLAVQMAEACLPAPPGQRLYLNYGFDKIRFITPVLVGSQVRGRFTLLSLAEKNPGQVLSNTLLEIDIKGHEKPAIVAHWLGMTVF